MNFISWPFYPEFQFSSVAASSRNSVSINIPFDVAVYGIAITASALQSDDSFDYNLQFTNYNKGVKLFDEAIHGFNIQADCRTYWPLYAQWFISAHDTIICDLNVLAGSDTESYYVTLLTNRIQADPNPGLAPFAYSFPMSMGFEDVQGGQTQLNFNQQVTQTKAKHALHDFDLHAIVFDGAGVDPLGIPDWSIQVSTEKRKLFDRLIIDGCIGGGTTYQQGGQVGPSSSNAFPFPSSNVIQYKLPRIERVKKGELMRVDVSPAPTYLPSGTIHTAFNQRVCTALIGKHIG